MVKIRLKGFTITKEALQQRFGGEMNNYEWNTFRKKIEQTWENRDFELKRIVVRHMWNSLENLDFKAQIVNDRLKFDRR